jgi:hypothetical protein
LLYHISSCGSRKTHRQTTRIQGFHDGHENHAPRTSSRTNPFETASRNRFKPDTSLQASSQGNRMMAMTAQPSSIPASGALQN